jgi:hypothetical protein
MNPTPIPEMTDAELLEAIRITRTSAWVSKFHREYLAQLEEEASHRKLKL